MPDMYFDVDTAITECPVNLMPLIDDTDFKTIEGAVAYNAAGMALFWHFVTSAGVYNNGVAVTPTTAGSYDWTDHGTHGIYTIEIPASGGASINNDTEGYGWFTGVATGVLPWRGPVIGFRAAALNDALCDGGDNLDVNTVQWLGTACATPTVAGVPEVDPTHWNGTAVATPTVAGVPEVDATHWNGTAVATPDTAGYPKTTIKVGTGTGELNLTSGAVPVKGNVKKNTALATFPFMMTDSTNHAPATGKTVTVTRSIDGGAFGAGTLSAVTEVGVGIYVVDFAAGDLNGNNIILRATATACDDTFERLITFVA